MSKGGTVGSSDVLEKGENLVVLPSDSNVTNEK
jgi:hypothetical protein